jgi:hypothetical protein
LVEEEDATLIKKIEGATQRLVLKLGLKLEAALVCCRDPPAELPDLAVLTEDEILVGSIVRRVGHGEVLDALWVVGVAGSEGGGEGVFLVGVEIDNVEDMAKDNKNIISLEFDCAAEIIRAAKCSFLLN